MDDNLVSRGKEVRKTLFGERPANVALESSPQVKPLLGWTADSVWTVWARPGLDLKYRSLVVCATLASLGRLEQLAIHLRGALRLGWTADELSEALLQVTCYAGAAAGADAFETLVQALRTYEAEPKEQAEVATAGT